MANRYWVGGTASWDGTAGTKWALTSGGAGGEAVPTTADDVFFDANSGANTITIATGNTGAKSIDCTGFTGTLTGTAGITVAGSVTLVAGMTYTHTGTVSFTGTGTLTTANKAFSAITLNAAGITVTLGDALNLSTRALQLLQGTFDTANYSLTCSTILSSGANSRAITLGSSTVTLSNAIDFTTSTNLTVNAGTSQINLTSASGSVLGDGKTFYNVSFTSTATGLRTITGANTFNSLTLTAPSSAGLTQLSISANQTVSGTFTCAGATGVRRCWVRSNTIGTSRTITAATLSANDCDFRDITVAGGAAGASPTRAGDCGGNSGITFPGAKTVYWNPTTATGFASATAWVTTSGGTDRSADNFPLAQDTAVFDNSSTANMGSNNDAVWNVGQMDLSNRTSAFTFTFGSNGFNIYTGWSTGSGVTYSGNVTTTFSGRTTMTFSTAGKTWPGDIVIDAPSSSLELGDAFSGSQGITLTRGTFNAKNYAVTCLTFTSNNTNTRTLTMGSGLWTISGTGSLWVIAASGLTFNKDTADILLSNTTASSRLFVGGALTYNKLTIGGATGTSTTEISSINTFSELASTKAVAHTISFVANQTITSWTITGTSGNVVTVNSNAAGIRRTITLGNVTSGIDYLSVKDIGIGTANRFYAGANSTDGGNNLNVLFTAAPLVISGTLAATSAKDTASLAGKLAHAGTLAETEGADLAGMSAALVRVGALTSADGADSAGFAGKIAHIGSLLRTEAGDVSAADGVVTDAINAGTLATTEPADLPATSGHIARTATLAAAESSDLAAMSGQRGHVGAAVMTEGGADTLSAAGFITVTGALAALEPRDSAHIDARFAISGVLLAAESGRDRCAVTNIVRSAARPGAGNLQRSLRPATAATRRPANTQTARRGNP